jgi:hypothetical protein
MLSCCAHEARLTHRKSIKHSQRYDTSNTGGGRHGGCAGKIKGVRGFRYPDRIRSAAQAYDVSATESFSGQDSRRRSKTHLTRKCATRHSTRATDTYSRTRRRRRAASVKRAHFVGETLVRRPGRAAAPAVRPPGSAPQQKKDNARTWKMNADGAAVLLIPGGAGAARTNLAAQFSPGRRGGAAHHTGMPTAYSPMHPVPKWRTLRTPHGGKARTGERCARERSAAGEVSDTGVCRRERRSEAQHGVREDSSRPMRTEGSLWEPEGRSDVHRDAMKRRCGGRWPSRTGCALRKGNHARSVVSGTRPPGPWPSAGPFQNTQI